MHKHHIIPKHMGGSDDPSNLVLLTVEEHAEAHRVLFEQYGRWQDQVAWKALSGMIGKEEIIYEIHKKMNLGRFPSAEVREKMAQAKRGRKISTEHAEALHNGRKNSKNSKEHNEAILKAKLGVALTVEHKNKISKSRKENPDIKLFASKAGKISSEKYKSDPERQKAHSERMKLWWKRKKEESVGT
jgi:hypothetical protein